MPPYPVKRRPDRRTDGQGMDTDLVVRAQHGDQDAFARLVEVICERFHGVAYGILRDMTLAEDAVQVALLALWRDLPRLRDPIAFEAWSYRILLRACYAESRRSRRWLQNLAGAGGDDPPVEGGFAAVDHGDADRAGLYRITPETGAGDAP